MILEVWSSTNKCSNSDDDENDKKPFPGQATLTVPKPKRISKRRTNVVDYGKVEHADDDLRDGDGERMFDGIKSEEEDSDMDGGLYGEEE